MSAWLAAALLASAPLMVEGVSVSRSTVVQGTRLQLNGVGTRQVLMFKAYLAALYVAEPSTSPEKLLRPGLPKVMVLRTLMDLDRGTMVTAFRRAVERNTKGSKEDWGARLAPFFDALRDSKKGSVVELIAVPGEGTTVRFAGETYRVVGDDATAVLFGMWLGAEPVDDGLKVELLGPPPPERGPATSGG